MIIDELIAIILFYGPALLGALALLFVLYQSVAIVGGDQFITVATTRPETMLGDTAVAVHPDDERYMALVGRHAVLPLTARLIPIVADT